MNCPEYKEINIDWPWPIAPIEEHDLTKTKEKTFGRRRVYFSPLTPVAPWNDLLTSTFAANHFGLDIGSTIALQEITDFFDPNNGPSPTGKYVDWNGLTMMTITMYTTKEEVINILYTKQTDPTVSPQLRGLKQIYDNEIPFLDEASPTLLEVEYWNYRVLLHIRNLLGITVPMENTRANQLYAQWQMEEDLTIGVDEEPFEPGPTELYDKPCGEQPVYVTFGEPCYPPDGQSVMVNSTPRGWFDILQQALYDILQNYEFQQSPFMDIMTAATVGFNFQLVVSDTRIRTSIVYQ